MRSEEIVRSELDCPTSVLSISATLDPNQSSAGSPDALRKGMMASETVGAEDGLVVGAKIFPRKTTPATKSRVAASAGAIHRVG